MKDKLTRLLANAYAPYSDFQVACIVVTRDGREFGGVNVENASYGATICAERSAILAAVSAGGRPGDFAALHCMVNSDRISTACFACRQVICEFFDRDVRCTFYNRGGDTRVLTVAELCPHPFDQTDLA